MFVCIYLPSFDLLQNLRKDNELDFPQRDILMKVIFISLKGFAVGLAF